MRPVRCFDGAFDAASEARAARHGLQGGRRGYSAHEGAICSLAAAPDGSGRVATASFDGCVKVWEPDGFREVAGEGEEGEKEMGASVERSSQQRTWWRL